MARPTFVAISESSLKHNLAKVHASAPGAKVWAVVKAQAYGHGIEIAMQAFASADGLALVEFEGAIRLRELGWSKPILMLEGAFDADDHALAQRLGLSLVIHNEQQLEFVCSAASSQPLRLYLKYNSGLNRLGFDASAFAKAYRRLLDSGRVEQVDFMTHFANSEVPGGTNEALQRFLDVTAGLDGARCTSNSAAIIGVPPAHQDWVRPGIMLYGATPYNERSAESLGLQAAMHFGSKLIAVQNLTTGDSVGYGYLFTAPETMQIGVVACGYADGYPRHAGPDTPILVAGQRTRVIGRVAMDMLMVDLRPVAKPEVGDQVELWGANIPIDEVAKASGTLGYELMCAIAPRVLRLRQP